MAFTSTLSIMTIWAIQCNSFQDNDISIITLLGTGSGTPDISFSIDSNSLQSTLSNYSLTHDQPSYPHQYVMGYRATHIKSSIKHLNGYLNSDAKATIIMENIFKIANIADSVKTHVLQRIEEYQKVQEIQTKNPSKSSTRKFAKHSKSNDSCQPPIVGPDSWYDTDYDVTTDDCGFFTGEHQGENNCYAYGTNIATDTYPQPGRGSGQEWTSNTCSDMFAAAERDGLIYVGQELQDYMIGPDDGHYVALYIWPNTNFHWARMDYNGTYGNNPKGTRRWSHKPGGTEVQITDNNGNCIGYPAPCVLPSQADLSPWSVFCGYMIATPSQLSIE